MPPKTLQWHAMGVLVVLTVLTTCLRSTMYLSSLQTTHDDAEAILPPTTTTATTTTTTTSKSNKVRSNSVAGLNNQDAAVLDKNIVDKNDYIYFLDTKRWDAAPIVLEKYKLVFFTIPKVACTTWKMLFRRVEGYPDWEAQNVKTYLPHDPNHNGLKYLWNYTMEEASEMMTSPEWTRAIFLRDPKQRLLSAFLDKAMSNEGHHITSKCCSVVKNCVPTTLEGFLELIKTCTDSHWAPQFHRMEPKYWKYIDFVGHVESAREDAKQLLQKIGAWEDWGKTGWGGNDDLAIFEKSAVGQTHSTFSEWKVWTWYTPALERKVEEYFVMDYANPQFNLPIKNLTKDYFIKGTDKIYAQDNWDGPPIVIEKFNLIFFTIPKVGGTNWKMLFRRMEGLEDWREIGGPKMLPHDPQGNGLTYLNDYNARDASEMIKSSNWTKAVFVRNPKDRFLSVYLDMRYKKEHVTAQCCPHEPGCGKQLSTMVRFLNLVEECESAHWEPQYKRMEKKYWKYIDFIGHLENIHQDGQRLLKKIGAWEDFGKIGWGPTGEDRVFTPTGHEMDHVHEALASYTPVIDRLVEQVYSSDYDNDLFHFPKVLSTIGK